MTLFHFNNWQPSQLPCWLWIKLSIMQSCFCCSQLFVSNVTAHLCFEGTCTSHFCEIRSIVISVSLSMCREVQRGKMWDWNAMESQLLVQLYHHVTRVNHIHLQHLFFLKQSVLLFASGYFYLPQFSIDAIVLSTWHTGTGLCQFIDGWPLLWGRKAIVKISI